MKTKAVSARINTALKARARKILAQEHLTLSDAIRILLIEVVRQKKMPIELAAAPRIVSGRRLWAMKRAQQARDLARGRRGKSAFMISPKEAREALIEWPDSRPRIRSCCASSTTQSAAR
jgi:addiction module RelB/DinJ family antitoxin